MSKALLFWKRNMRMNSVETYCNMKLAELNAEKYKIQEDQHKFFLSYSEKSKELLSEIDGLTANVPDSDTVQWQAVLQHERSHDEWDKSMRLVMHDFALGLSAIEGQISITKDILDIANAAKETYCVCNG